jgi:hypothetical protein
MSLENEQEDKRTPGGQFSKGQSGNPPGRPAGSRNKATLAMYDLMDGESDAITRKLIEVALQGNSQALRLCLERAYPPRKERLIAICRYRISRRPRMPPLRFHSFSRR